MRTRGRLLLLLLLLLRYLDGPYRSFGGGLKKDGREASWQLWAVRWCVGIWVGRFSDSKGREKVPLYQSTIDRYPPCGRVGGKRERGTGGEREAVAVGYGRGGGAVASVTPQPPQAPSSLPPVFCPLPLSPPNHPAIESNRIDRLFFTTQLIQRVAGFFFFVLTLTQIDRASDRGGKHDKRPPPNHHHIIITPNPNPTRTRGTIHAVAARCGLKAGHALDSHWLFD